MKTLPFSMQHEIQQCLVQHPKAPSLTRDVWQALGAGPEAAALWRLLGKDSVTGWKVVDLVRSANEQAHKEIARPSKKPELDDLNLVINKAKSLKRAIKSSLPADQAVLFAYDLKGAQMPTIPLEFCFHRLKPGGDEIAYPLVVNDVLDWLIEQVTLRRAQFPLRALTRQGHQPLVQAFVRHLAWQFGQAFGQEHRTSIGHIATAVFELPDPLDKAGVNAILKDRPVAFKSIRNPASTKQY